ncbi:hypothetical protein [Jeotgalibacillus sp. R-1-5s-1]|uniref:hypothetical protein n=1 Tax=Jeotgalibacillus sp. R-1-5s-1 TaxID=2555897 RepID=UPI001FC831F3|nr:hypothetical protein [Jeotgalibacillus sp. R-1-5s-1]
MMSENIRLARIVSWSVLLGMPIFFLLISILTNEWLYLWISFIPAFLAGYVGLIVTRRKISKLEGETLRPPK